MAVACTSITVPMTATRRFWPILMLAIAALAGGGCERPGHDAPLLIEDIAVVHLDGTIAEHQDIVIRDAVIASVAAHRRSEGGKRRAGGSVVDGRGLYAIPGLWDMHVHLTLSPEWGSRMRRHFLAYGVTSVRDMGAAARDLPRLQANDREPLSPRVYACGPMLDGQPPIYSGVGDYPPLGEGVDTAVAAREAVVRLAARGVDCIKAYEMLTPAAFAAIVAEAATRELPVAAHVPLSMRAGEVSDLGVASIEHLRNLEFECAADADQLHRERTLYLARHAGESAPGLREIVRGLQSTRALEGYDGVHCDALIRRLAANHTYQTPTFGLIAYHEAAPYADPRWHQALAHAPAAIRRKLAARATSAAEAEDARKNARFATWAFAVVGRMQQAGVPLLAGSDTPSLLQLPGESLHRELELLVAAGLTPLQALRSATLGAAQFFHLEDRFGEVRRGHAGDLVLLEANPLEDIRHTRRIVGVVARGRHFDRAALAELLR